MMRQQHQTNQQTNQTRRRKKDKQRQRKNSQTTDFYKHRSQKNELARQIESSTKSKIHNPCHSDIPKEKSMQVWAYGIRFSEIDTWVFQLFRSQNIAKRHLKCNYVSILCMVLFSASSLIVLLTFYSQFSHLKWVTSRLHDVVTQFSSEPFSCMSTNSG